MLFISTLVFSAESTQVYAQTTKNQASQNKKQSKKIVIKSGDTLSKIAQKHGTKYLRIFYANKNIKNPDVIYPGDKVRIPSPNEKLAKRALPKTAKSTPSNASAPAQSAQVSSAAVQSPAPTPVYSNSPSGGVWDRLAQCESGGNWSINTGNGYYGGLQFTPSSWRAVGGSGLPHQASKAEQIARGKMLQARQGWGAWPACTAKLGIR
jgi:LysM repeat protein